MHAAQRARHSPHCCGAALAVPQWAGRHGAALAGPHLWHMVSTPHVTPCASNALLRSLTSSVASTECTRPAATSACLHRAGWGWGGGRHAWAGIWARCHPTTAAASSSQQPASRPACPPVGGYPVDGCGPSDALVSHKLAQTQLACASTAGHSRAHRGRQCGPATEQPTQVPRAPRRVGACQAAGSRGLWVPPPRPLHSLTCTLPTRACACLRAWCLLAHLRCSNPRRRRCRR